MQSLKIPLKSATTGNPVTLTIRQKACCPCKFVFFFFLLIRKKIRAARRQFVSIDLDATFIALPFSIIRFDFFCLQVLLTRVSLLALAKSILSEYDKQLKRRF